MTSELAMEAEAVGSCLDTIFEAVKSAGVRALVSAGWGGLGGSDIPDEVFILKGELYLFLQET